MMLRMRSVALPLIVSVSVWSGDLSAANLSRTEALAVAERAAGDRGVDVNDYVLSETGKELSDDDQEWSFLYQCKPVTPSLGCHFLVIVNRVTGAAEISASATDPPRKRDSPEIRAVFASSTKEECEAHKGTWFQFGMLNNERCDIGTPDAGKQCTDTTV
jgi:hypothetical protein